MNKHTKLAIVIAPFLAIGGYIAAGYYADAKMKKQFGEERYLKLAPQGKCEIKSGECKLGNGDFLLNLAENKQGIKLATTHPVSNVVISLVYKKQDAQPEKLYKLKQDGDALNWRMQVDSSALQNVDKLRLMVMINKVSYLGEINNAYSHKEK